MSSLGLYARKLQYANSLFRELLLLKLHSAYFIMKLACHGIQIGKPVQVSGDVFLRLHPLGNLKIGGGCRFKSQTGCNPLGRFHKLSFVIAKGGLLEIGNCVGISNSTIYASSKVSIGDNSLIGAGCTIVDSDFHYLSTNVLNKEDKSVPKKPVAIGKNVFIGAFCIVLKGVSIGDGAIIGAGSIITRNIPPGQIWAGNPAMFKKNVSDRSG